jgi:hypothetical protein
MLVKWVGVSLCIAAFASAAMSQETSRQVPPLNFNVGGGVGFPLGATSDFSGDGGTFVVGGGPNFGRFLGVSGEFMWNNLPIKSSVLRAVQIPGASARQYALTVNGILRVPTHGKLGAYVIGGGGWYHRSGELTAPIVVPGTVCSTFWVWWGSCVSGLFPANAVLASSSSNAFGGNIGGGLTFRLGAQNAKVYTEVRYHHASYNHVNTNLLPLTFGLRW